MNHIHEWKCDPQGHRDGYAVSMYCTGCDSLTRSAEGECAEDCAYKPGTDAGTKRVKVLWSMRGRCYLDVPAGADPDQVKDAFYKHIEEGGPDEAGGGSCDGYEFDGYEEES